MFKEPLGKCVGEADRLPGLLELLENVLFSQNRVEMRVRIRSKVSSEQLRCIHSGKERRLTSSALGKTRNTKGGVDAEGGRGSLKSIPEERREDRGIARGKWVLRWIVASDPESVKKEHENTHQRGLRPCPVGGGESAGVGSIILVAARRGNTDGSSHVKRPCLLDCIKLLSKPGSKDFLDWHCAVELSKNLEGLFFTE